MRILFMGDIVGKPGRKTVKQALLPLIQENNIDLVIANGENAAGGKGITPEVMEELFSLKIDILTSGNHIYDNKEVLKVIDSEKRLVRPANFPAEAPGKGATIVKAGEHLVGIINLAGRVFMPPVDCPFQQAEQEVALLERITPIIIVDFHAEATSEKLAMGWLLKDRVSAVIGTHTHVQTADDRIIPPRAAYISDVGMVGPYNSVLGLNPDMVLQQFLQGLPLKTELARGECVMSAVLLNISPADGKAIEIQRIFNKIYI